MDECRNCGAPQQAGICQHCGAHTGIPSSTTVLCPKSIERRRPLNSGIRRVYNAMIKAGSFKRR